MENKIKKTQISAVVLAGGESVRMGENKALLKLGEKTMIERIIDTLRPIFNDIILVTNNPEKYKFLKDIIYIKDKIVCGERNPLVGIYTGLIEASTPHTFIVPCDMPFLNKELICHMVNQLEDEDVLIPFVEGHYQPLHAIYGKKCIEPIKKLLKEKKYKIINFFPEVSIKKIDEKTVKRFSKDFRCFLNINTYDTYLSIKQHWN